MSLTVTGPGGTNTKTLSAYILAYNAPIANFVSAPSSGWVPLTVKFTDKSKGTILSRVWDFGDGQTSSDTNPVHTYSTAGNYTVTLTLQGAVGSSTKTGSVQVLSMVGQWVVSGTDTIKARIPGHTISAKGPDPGTLIFNADYSLSSSNQSIYGTWSENASGFSVDCRQAILQALNDAITGMGGSGSATITVYSFTGTHTSNKITMKGHIGGTLNITSPVTGTGTFTVDVNYSGTQVSH